MDSIDSRRPRSCNSRAAVNPILSRGQTAQVKCVLCLPTTFVEVRIAMSASESRARLLILPIYLPAKNYYYGLPSQPAALAFQEARVVSFSSFSAIEARSIQTFNAEKGLMTPAQCDESGPGRKSQDVR